VVAGVSQHGPPADVQPDGSISCPLLAQYMHPRATALPRQRREHRRDIRIICRRYFQAGWETPADGSHVGAYDAAAAQGQRFRADLQLPPLSHSDMSRSSDIVMRSSGSTALLALPVVLLQLILQCCDTTSLLRAARSCFALLHAAEGKLAWTQQQRPDAAKEQSTKVFRLPRSIARIVYLHTAQLPLQQQPAEAANGKTGAAALPAAAAVQDAGAAADEAAQESFRVHPSACRSLLFRHARLHFVSAHYHPLRRAFDLWHILAFHRFSAEAVELGSLTPAAELVFLLALPAGALQLIHLPVAYTNAQLQALFSASSVREGLQSVLLDTFHEFQLPYGAGVTMDERSFSALVQLPCLHRLAFSCASVPARLVRMLAEARGLCYLWLRLNEPVQDAFHYDAWEWSADDWRLLARACCRVSHLVLQGWRGLPARNDAPLFSALFHTPGGLAPSIRSLVLYSITPSAAGEDALLSGIAHRCTRLQELHLLECAAVGCQRSLLHGGLRLPRHCRQLHVVEAHGGQNIGPGYFWAPCLEGLVCMLRHLSEQDPPGFAVAAAAAAVDAVSNAAAEGSLSSTASPLASGPHSGTAASLPPVSIR